MAPSLPPCGLYRTTAPVAGVPAGRLVYFHNHGDPGPGVYLPKSWSLNRADWHRQGHTLPDAALAQTLEPLPAEGLYAVSQAFFCCEKRCVEFRQGQLVQLGYDGEANALVFVPEWTRQGLGFPQQGSRVERPLLSRLQRLDVPRAAQSADDSFLH